MTSLVECGPGKVLTSLNRRIESGRELKVLALEDPASIAAALAAGRSREHMSMLAGRSCAGHRRHRAASAAPSRSSSAARGARRRHRHHARPAPQAIAAPGSPGSGGRGVVLDVADAAPSRPASSRARGAAGAPSILVNNAAITRDGLLMRMSAEDWQAVHRHRPERGLPHLQGRACAA